MSNLIETPKLKPLSDFTAEGKSIRQTNAEYLTYLREFLKAVIDSRKTADVIIDNVNPLV